MPFLIKVIGVLVSLSMRYNSNVSKEKIKLENQLKKLSLDRDTDREWNNYLQEKQNKKKLDEAFIICLTQSQAVL